MSLRERRSAKKEAKNARKYGYTPTGEVMSKRMYKQMNKYGWDDELGMIRTKGDYKMLHSNKANRRERNQVKGLRAITGNTFGNSLSQIFGGLFG